MTSPVDSNSAAQILSEALALPEDRRPAYVDRACDGDAPLAAEVRSLLREAESADDFLAEPAMGPAGSLAIDSVAADLSDGRPADALPEIPGFDVRRLVGAGGMAVVYEATQHKPRRRVALKLLRQPLPTVRDVERFEFEMDVLAGLDHPGIARLHQSGQFTVAGRPQPYLVMEYVDGRPLDADVRDRRPPVREVVRLVLEAVDAIGSAHRRGVVHRDLKPANILVTDEGTVRVVDFGVARLLDRGTAADPRLTLPGTVVGTPAYMPPEQADGRDDEVDHRADVYALGTVLYELLAGRPPIDLSDLSRGEAIRAVAEEDPAPLRSVRRNVPRDLDAVVRKAMAKRRRDRYADAGALGDDLRRFLANRPVTARGAGRVYRVVKFVRRHRVALVASAAVLAIGVVLAAPYVRRSAFGVTVQAVSAAELELTWEDAFTGESHYVVERLAGNEWGEVMVLPKGSKTTKLGGLEPGRVYNYRVRADGPLGTLGYSQIASVVMPAADWRSPGRFRAHPPGPDRVKLAWSARPGDLTYRLRVSTGSIRDWTHVVDLMPGTNTFEVTGLNPGTTYHFQAGAIIPNGRVLWTAPLRVDTPASAGEPSKGSKVPDGTPAETDVN